MQSNPGCWAVLLRAPVWLGKPGGGLGLEEAAAAARSALANLFSKLLSDLDSPRLPKSKGKRKGYRKACVSSSFFFAPSVKSRLLLGFYKQGMFFKEKSSRSAPQHSLGEKPSFLTPAPAAEGPVGQDPPTQSKVSGGQWGSSYGRPKPVLWECKNLPHAPALLFHDIYH